MGYGMRLGRMIATTIALGVAMGGMALAEPGPGLLPTGLMGVTGSVLGPQMRLEVVRDEGEVLRHVVLDSPLSTTRIELLWGRDKQGVTRVLQALEDSGRLLGLHQHSEEGLRRQIIRRHGGGFMIGDSWVDRDCVFRVAIVHGRGLFDVEALIPMLQGLRKGGHFGRLVPAGLSTELPPLRDPS